MATIGDTIKIRSYFRAFETDSPIDPEIINFIVYDSERKIIHGPIILTGANRVDSGVYEYIYTIPAGYTTLTYEFIGNPEGLPAVTRGTIICNWIPK